MMTMFEEKTLIVDTTNTVGSWLVRRPIESSYKVRAIVRSISCRQPSGVFNICDERLVAQKRFMNLLSGYSELSMPRQVLKWLTRRAVVLTERLSCIRGATHAPFLAHTRIKLLTLDLDASIVTMHKKHGHNPKTDLWNGMQAALDRVAGAGLVNLGADRKAGWE